MIFASDLDQTLIYSKRSMGSVPDQEMLIPVEIYEGRFISFMTAAAMEQLKELTALAAFVPVTARTPEQYNRIFALRERYKPTYAIVSNGGAVLRNGQPDAGWREAVKKSLRGGAAPEDVMDRFNRIADERWVKSATLCDGLFYSIVVERALVPTDAVEAFKSELAPLGWQYSLQGRKIYLVPNAVSKGAAIRHVKRELGASFVVAAGDSLLDESLLLAADAAVAPNHGELRSRYAEHAHIRFTANSGIQASKEILSMAVEWMKSKRSGRDEIHT